MGRIIALMLLTISSATVWADGMAFVPMVQSLEVQASAQRAVIWQRDGAWEIHIQPVFDREAAAAAWVVPFPVLPEIEESSAELFDQLELLTSPLFISGEAYASECPCMQTGAAVEADPIEPQIEVWDQGVVGMLEFAVISASDGGDIHSWLTTNGFAVAQDAQQKIGELAAEGSYFFAARLAAEADPTLPLTPVRFKLAGLDRPFYPMRLTALGVPVDAHLGLTLWLITPRTQAYLPSSYGYSYLDEYVARRDSYETGLAASLGPASLTITYSSSYTYSERMQGYISGMDPVNFAYYFAELTGELAYGAVEWCPEIEELAGQNALLQRLQGEISDLGQDIWFEAVERTQLSERSNVYADISVYWEPCDPEIDCSWWEEDGGPGEDADRHDSGDAGPGDAGEPVCEGGFASDDAGVRLDPVGSGRPGVTIGCSAVTEGSALLWPLLLTGLVWGCRRRW